jgi:hypothetical protein
MSEHVVRKCDECGELRDEPTKWWAVVENPLAPKFTDFEDAEAHAAQARDDRRGLFRLDYCSHKCVGSAFHRWLDTGDVRPNSATPTKLQEETVQDEDIADSAVLVAR